MEPDDRRPTDMKENNIVSTENDSMPGSEDCRIETEEGSQSKEIDVNRSDEPVLKRVKRKLSWKTVTVAAVVAAVILFAFIWEAVSSGDPVFIGGGRSGRKDREENEFAARSEIQRELDDLDWVWQAFLTINEFSRPGDLLEEINGIVIHYIGNPGTTAMQNRDFFENLSVTEERYASSNFIVDLDGQIVQCVPADEVAYASNVRNNDTLSIELCHPDETGKFTDETYAAAVRLTAWLCARLGLTSDDLLRHYDITGKLCPLYFVENEDAWEQFKADVNQVCLNPEG